MVKTNTKALLNKYLKELFLSTMRQCYEDLANQARQESLSYDQYLLALTELECITRQNNRIERNLKASRISRDKNIDTFDLKRVPAKVAQQARTLLEGAFVEFYLKTRKKTKRLVVPVSAVLEEQGAYYLYVQMTGESFTKRSVNPGESDGKVVEISEGINPGDRIVTNGVMLLKASSAVSGDAGHGHSH